MSAEVESTDADIYDSIKRKRSGVSLKRQPPHSNAYISLGVRCKGYWSTGRFPDSTLPDVFRFERHSSQVVGFLFYAYYGSLYAIDYIR